jgi:hypothetical protein
MKPRKASDDRYETVSALSDVLDVVIDVCLEAGVTSPELESMLRARFVHRALEKAPRNPRTGARPTDVSLALTVGLHRVEVKRIREGGTPAKVKNREQLYWKGGKVLRGWMENPRFLTSSGHPMDLPIEAHPRTPSFYELVAKYLPFDHPPNVIKYLSRRGFVTVLPDEIIRFRSLTPTRGGVTPGNIAESTARMRRLGMTLLDNLRSPHPSGLYAETKPVNVAAEHRRAVENLLATRSGAFLSQLENEIRDLYNTAKKSNTVRIGISVFSWASE